MKILILKELFDTERIPKGIKYRTKIKNKGSNLAKEIHVASFKTSKNNKVDIIIDPEQNHSYKVSFFVNGKMEEQPRGIQDTEILSGVLNLLPKIADKYNMEEIQIESWTDNNEFHITRNLPLEDKKEFLLKKLNHYLKAANKNDLPFYNNAEKEYGIKMVSGFLEILGDKEKEASYIHNIKDFVPPPHSNISTEISEAYKEYRKRVLSNTEDGYKIPKNRRHNIYKNLLPRFMPHWDIKEIAYGVAYKGFELTRKK